MIREGDLLLVRRGRGANAGLWAIPGGKVDYGETMRAAADAVLVNDGSMEELRRTAGEFWRSLPIHTKEDGQ